MRGKTVSTQGLSDLARATALTAINGYADRVGATDPINRDLEAALRNASPLARTVLAELVADQVLDALCEAGHVVAHPPIPSHAGALSIERDGLGRPILIGPVHPLIAIAEDLWSNPPEEFMTISTLPPAGLIPGPGRWIVTFRCANGVFRYEVISKNRPDRLWLAVHIGSEPAPLHYAETTMQAAGPVGGSGMLVHVGPGRVASVHGHQFPADVDLVTLDEAHRLIPEAHGHRDNGPDGCDGEHADRNDCPDA
jgi:hypothetical protein